MTKRELRYIRCIQLIEDPFPEHSEHNQIMSRWDKFLSIFGFGPTIKEPERINIWKAYKMGYDKAYAEVEKYCTEDYREVYEGQWINLDKEEKESK